MPASDDGLLRGDGVFEVIRLYAGRPYALGEHLDRLERSAAALELPVERAELESEIAALLAEFGEHEAQLRLVITRGGRRIASTENLPALGEVVTLASVTYSPTVILTGVKSLSYAANMQATRLAKAEGAEEAVLVRPDGIVLEPPTSTVFWVSSGGQLANTVAGGRDPRLDHARPDRRRARGRGGRVPDRRPAQRPGGVPRLDRPRGPAGFGRRRH